MYCLIVLVLLFKILCDENFKIRKAYFLENNFWNYDKNPIKTEKGYLQKIRIVSYEHYSFGFGHEYSLKNCFYLNYTKHLYALLHDWNFDDFISLSNTSKTDNNFLRLHFLFKDYRQLSNDIKKMQYYESFKWLEKSLDHSNSAKLKCDEAKARKISTEENLRRIVDMEFYKIDKYIQKIGKKDFLKQLECDKDFNLIYFQDYLQCFETLKNLITSFPHFKLIKDNFSDETIDINTTMKISELMKYIDDKLKEDFKKVNDYLSKSLTTIISDEKFLKHFETLTKKCFNLLVPYMLDNNIFYPITDNYSIDHYLNELYDCVYEVVKVNLFRYEMTEQKKKDIFFASFFDKIFINLQLKQKAFLKEVCETDLFYRHFSQLLGRQIKTSDDFIIVEKIFCDFHNMLVYLTNIGYPVSKSFISKQYRCPIFTDDYDCSIIRGIKIELTNEFLADFKYIQAYNDEGRIVNFRKNEHYFASGFCTFYTTSDILRLLNIKEIELVTKKNGSRYILNIGEYLNS